MVERENWVRRRLKIWKNKNWLRSREEWVLVLHKNRPKKVWPNQLKGGPIVERWLVLPKEHRPN